MPDSSTPPESNAVSAHAVLEYWMARLPRKAQSFGKRRAHGSHASRSVVRLPTRFGFEAWWIHWPPGSLAPLHDHGRSSSVVGVLHGTLHELIHASGMGVRARRNWTPEHIVEIDGGECHEVRNASNATAASVHVYQSRLESMTFYQRTAAGKLEPICANVTSRQ